MQVTEMASNGLERALEVRVSYAEIESRLMKRLGDIGRNARIPGFRPGHVPISHLRRLYARSVVPEIVESVVSETSRTIIGARKERPVGNPRIELQSAGDDVGLLVDAQLDLVYRIEFEVYPEFEVADLSGISLTRFFSSVSEDDIDAEVERIAENKRPFHAVESSRSVQIGDRVTVDFEGFVDGKPFNGGTGKDVSLVIGSGGFIPGFAEQLTGSRVGDHKTVTVVLPKRSMSGDRAGKEACFKVLIKSLFEPEGVLSGDDLAKAVGVENFDRLRTVVRAQLEQNLEDMSRYKLKRTLLDALDVRHDFDIPKVLLLDELDSILDRIRREGDVESYLEDKDLREVYGPIASRRVRLGLVLSHIAKMEGIGVSAEEMRNALQEYAAHFPGQADAVYALYRDDPGRFAPLQAPILEDKVIDFILSRVKVSEKAVSMEELLCDVDPEDDFGRDGSAGQQAGGKGLVSKVSRTKKASKTAAAEGRSIKGGSDEGKVKKGSKKAAAGSKASKAKASSERSIRGDTDEEKASPRRGKVARGRRGAEVKEA